MRSSPDVLETLAQRIRALESSPRDGRVLLPLRVPLLHCLLSETELPAGSLVELRATAEGAGIWTVGLLLARAAAVERRALVVVDGRGWFYPPAAARLGIDLEHVIVVHPANKSQTHAALDKSLGCTAVGAVVGCCEPLRPAEARRFKLAAEAGGGLGVLLQAADSPAGASFADLRLSLAPLAAATDARRVRVEVTRWRWGKAGQSLILEIDDATGDVRVSAELAAPEDRTRKARAAQ